jgi:hypothetical protein
MEHGKTAVVSLVEEGSGCGDRLPVHTNSWAPRQDRFRVEAGQLLYFAHPRAIEKARYHVCIMHLL